MKIKLCGKELELKVDMADAKEVSQLEDSVEELTKKLVELEQQTKKYSQIIREEVKYTRKWLDKLFEKGIGQQVLSEDDSLHDVYLVLRTMGNLRRLYSKQIVEEAITKALEKYSPQRAQRSE